jgi:ATP-dependent helicase/nuclease subunit A
MKNITFIYAGAGSGKTHKLTDLLFEKINSNEITSNEVMLSTFTKKAANEIKERAQAKLLSKNLFEDANKLNQAFIGTVHSVGYQFIKKYWYLLGISPEIIEIGENEKEVFFAKAISEIPTEEELDLLNELNFDFNFQSYINDYKTYDPSKWIKDVKSIMEFALTNQIDLENDKNSLHHSLEVQKSVFKGDLSVSEVLRKLNNNINILIENSLTKKDYAPLLQKSIELARINEKSALSIRLLMEIDAFNTGLKNLYSAQRDENIKNSLNDCDVSQTLYFQEKVLTYTNLIFKLANKALGKYTDFKKQKGLIDFTDMEVYFLKLLDIEEVKLDISKSLKLVMVDEFQDSNPIQLTIFMKLSELVQQSYWVGDPKQAIYGFRGSDPVLIDKVMEKFTQQNDANLKVEILKMSWRSAAPLVHFSNAIFGPALQNQVSDIYLEDKHQLNGDDHNDDFTSWRDTVTIQPLSSKETISLFPVRTEAQKINGLDHLIFFNVFKSGNSDLKFAKKELLFNATGKQIKKMLSVDTIEVFDKSIGKHRKLVGSDICLLTSSNADVSKIATEFSQLGIPVNALVPGLTKTIEYRFVKNIAVLLLDKNNVLSKTELAFLNGEVSDWKKLIENRIDFILEEPKTDDKEELKSYFKSWLVSKNYNELIQKIQVFSSHLSIAHTIREIINQFNLFLKTAAFANVSSRQSNLLRLIELVDEYEESCIKMNVGSGLADFFNFIESSSINDTQKGNSDKHAIQVMTYHKAKGLEWPVVYLLSIDKDHFYEFFPNKYFSTSVFNQGEFSIETPLKNRIIEFLWWPLGTKTSPNELLTAELENTNLFVQKQKQTQNEMKRLLYVGITRSRDSLVFASNQKKNLTWLENVIEGFDFEAVYNQHNLETAYNLTFDLFKTEQPVKYIKEVIEETSYEAIPYKSTYYFQKEIPKTQDKPYVITPSKQPSLTNVQIIELQHIHDRLKFNQIETDQLGNTLHTMLYAKNKSYFERNVELLNSNNELGLDCKHFIENTKSFEDYIITTFKPMSQYPELHLECIIGNNKAVGEADLVLELENELILIDYKSFPGKKEEIFSKTSEFYAGKYSGQLALYSQMLASFSPKPVTRKLIYYVVQGVVIELKM